MCVCVSLLFDKELNVYSKLPLQFELLLNIKLLLCLINRVQQWTCSSCACVLYTLRRCETASAWLCESVVKCSGTQGLVSGCSPSDKFSPAACGVINHEH